MLLQGARTLDGLMCLHVEGPLSRNIDLLSSQQQYIGIDVEGYTLVCDEETNSLHVYDATGQKCGTIVKNMQSPKGIVLHKGDLYL